MTTSETPLITAVITTFKRPEMLKRAIQSVQNQTISDISICIYDSASQDNTEEVVESLAKNDHRIHYYCYPQRVTAVENYQFGMDQVKTPFFSFLSDDDFLLSDCYEKALALFNKYPEAQFFLGSTVDAVFNGKPISATAKKWPDQEFFSSKEGLLHVISSYFNWSGAVYKTKAVFPLNSDVVAVDYDFILRLAAHYPFTFSSTPCAVFTHHTGSFSNHCGLQLIYPTLPKIADSIYKMRPIEEYPHLKRSFTKLFLRKSLSIGIQNVMRKDFSELKQIGEAIQKEDSGLLAKSLVLLFKLLDRSFVMRFLLLKAFVCYRFVKSFKVQNYLNNSAVKL